MRSRSPQPWPRTAPLGDNQLSAVVLEGVFTAEVPTLPSDWTGNVYFDDIQITVP